MKKILLIEDNDDIRNNTCEILELANYEVQVAENGKLGVEKALRFKPDLIICDIMMPELDGYGVLHAVQKNESIQRTPFIFLTAKTERSDFRKGMESGADDYITKPFDGTELLAAVDGRLKKMDWIKKEATAGIEGVRNLARASAEKTSWVSLTEMGDVDRFKKKQVIYTEGNHPNKLYYISTGKVKTFKSNEDGKELITNLFQEGDFLGHVPLLEGTLYSDTAEALEDTELIVIAKDDFNRLISQHTDIARKFIQILAKNVADKENQLLAMAYNSLRKKVADALLMVCEKYHGSKEPPYTIDMSRESLSNIAGTATESLVRTLSDFRQEKMIDIQDGKIIIMDISKLRKLLN